MTTDDNKATIRRYLDLGNDRDAEAYAAFYAPDATNHGRPVGREGLRRVHAELHATFPDARNTIEEPIAEGDAVVCHVRTTATHLGTPASIPVLNLLGIPPTGKPVVLRSIHITHLKDGLITSHLAVRDDLELMKQIGFWPPAAGTDGAAPASARPGQAGG